jgi:DNA-binding MarR family transcriptional regulator
MPRTVGDIGATVGMDTGTLTPLLKRLVSAGLVTRERDTKDERRVLIGLTPAAERIREAVLGIPAKIKTACRLSDKGLADLRDTLNGLAHAPPSECDEKKD